MSEAARLAELSLAIRESSLKRFRAVPPNKYDWRPASGAMSIADLVQHLIDADGWLFDKIRDPSIRAMKGQPGRTRVRTETRYRALVNELEDSGQRRFRSLAAMSDELLAETVYDERFDGDVSVWWLILRGNLDHEAHHRGQLSVYLRILGITST
jgi:uncharacterized damage-inducible protein DinB